MVQSKPSLIFFNIPAKRIAMNKTTFSVIIPTYNRADSLNRALRSLASQTYKNFEVIVSDDGSTDHTEKVVSSFQNDLNIKYIWEENWGGPARPRNNGIRAASSEWICFLDSDDWWYPNKLSTCYSYLENAELIHHDLRLFKKGKKTIRRLKSRQLIPPVFVDLMTKGNAIFTSSCVVRKEILYKAGLFDCDRNLISVEDFDLWLRISKITDRFKYIPEVLGSYWIGNENISNNSMLRFHQIFSVYQKHLSQLSQTDRNQAEAFMSYLLGRIRQKSGFKKEAYNLFKKSFHSKKLEIKIKSLVLLLYLKLSFRDNI